MVRFMDSWYRVRIKRLYKVLKLIGKENSKVRNIQKIIRKWGLLREFLKNFSYGFIRSLFFFYKVGFFFRVFFEGFSVYEFEF